MSTPLRRTPFYDEHRANGAKLVAFHGWEMPLQHAPGIVAEHEAVRTAAGLFDVSHMARFVASGEGAVAFVDRLITNDLAKLSAGRLLYTAMCREDGGVLDDVTVYKFDPDVLVVVNAGNRERIWDWMQARAAEWKGTPFSLSDKSADYAQLALQGPRAQAMLAPLAGSDLDAIPYYGHSVLTLNGAKGVLVSRNGYTGEDGFEIYVPVADGPALFRALVERGRAAGLLPAGLGCRDTLRLEMAYCLYGNELDLDVNPLEARLAWVVKLKKPSFIGREALASIKQAGPRRALAGFRVAGNRFPRKDQALILDGQAVGRVTSGGFSPSLKAGIGLGFVPPELAAPGSKFSVDVRGEAVPAEAVSLPFYQNASHR